MTDEQIPITGMTVAIGMPVGKPIPPHTVISLCHTVQRCTEMGVRCDIIMEVSGVVQMTRDCVLDSFLKGDAQKLFWIDSDMAWSPDDFLRMLAISTKVGVLAASYPARMDGPLSFYVDYAKDRKIGPFGVQEINGAGLGFTVMDRSIAEELAAKAPRVTDTLNEREMAAVFRVDIVDGKRRTEDMAFFADIRDLGHTVWMDPSIELGHIGEKQWRGRIMDAFKKQAA